MNYICVKCKKIWGEELCVCISDLSSGLCASCYISYVREKQRKKGYHDCFGRATEDCSRKDCFYYEPCMKIMKAEIKKKTERS